MDVGVDTGGGKGCPDLSRPAGKCRRLPALRVAEEELHGLCTHRDRLGQRVAVVQMGSDPDHGPSLAGSPPCASGWPSAQPKPPCATPRPRPTNEAMTPAMMKTRS